MPRSGKEAVAWAKGKHSWSPSGMCQQFSRSAFNVGAYYGSAALAWRMARKKHYVSRGSQVPAGVPVFWTGGSRGYGHVAISIGGGLCRSTDWPRRYSVGTARIDDISRAWGQRLVGWTEDINTVTIYHGTAAATPPKPKHTLDLSTVVKAVKNEEKLRNGILLKKAVGEEVGKGDMMYRDSRLGPGFRAQYKLVQRKYLKSKGVTNPSKSDINGIPGEGSLTWLGKRHDFGVKA